jgi:hypothetical protein
MHLSLTIFIATVMVMVITMIMVIVIITAMITDINTGMWIKSLR